MKSPKKKEMAGKMVSKTYINTRCGHCGKFGHSHESHQPIEKYMKKRRDARKSGGHVSYHEYKESETESRNKGYPAGYPFK